MDTDDSLFICEFTNWWNKIVAEGNGTVQPDTIELENELVDDPNIVPAELRSEIANSVPRIIKARQRTARTIRRDIAAKWGPAFEAFDQCIGFADMLSARWINTMFTNHETLKGKEPSPIPGVVTGAYLKCLLLLGLCSKSCGIATEISYLLRDGFPDGALSRLRTLHEHLVIMALLGDDHTYEVCERYQDSAVFEELRQLYVELASLKEPMWDVLDGLAEDLAQKIEEAEPIASEVISRRGTKIKYTYEWARPAMPLAKRANPKYRITFADLEVAAGMDFYRGSYLVGTGRIHAGAYAAISHLDFDSIQTPRSRPRRDDSIIPFAACRASELLSWIGRVVGTSISWETEEYDEFLYVGELKRAARVAELAFAETNTNPPPPDRCRFLPCKIRIKVERPQRSEDERP
jgi:hypothetical protein